MKTIFSICALSFMSVFYAQKLTPDVLKNMQLDNYKQILKQAAKYNDGAAAINSLHQIIALEGENSVYKDSLAIVYYRIGNFSSSHLLSKELLNKKPNDITLLEINAISLKQLNATKEAISAYETLFNLTKNMYHGYELAFLQYNIKRLAESGNTLSRALQCEDIKDISIQMPYGKNQAQNVPLKAAAFNLYGIVLFELKDNKNAQLSFDEALKIFPDFQTAKINKNAVNVELSKNETSSNKG